MSRFVAEKMEKIEREQVKMVECIRDVSEIDPKAASKLHVALIHLTNIAGLYSDLAWHVEDTGQTDQFAGQIEQYDRSLTPALAIAAED